MSDLDFIKFPKMHRLKRECMITEKLDGTNAQIVFSEDGEMLCGSRNRVITPEDDNHGFATWATERQQELFNLLGEGRHYGEWWGQGIHRKYGLDEKRFSLFNASRWSGLDGNQVDGVHVVPILFEGLFTTDNVDFELMRLHDVGSSAAPGFRNPEGIVVFHKPSQTTFKLTFEHDETGKP